jgi:hypothetical protein
MLTDTNEKRSRTGYDLILTHRGLRMTIPVRTAAAHLPRAIAVGKFDDFCT